MKESFIKTLVKKNSTMERGPEYKTGTFHAFLKTAAEETGENSYDMHIQFYASEAGMNLHHQLVLLLDRDFHVIKQAYTNGSSINFCGEVWPGTEELIVMFYLTRDYKHITRDHFNSYHQIFVSYKV